MLPSVSELFTDAGKQFRQFTCSLHGHDPLLHFERERLSLLCTSCGYKSPGWEIKTARRYQDVARSRPHVVHMPLPSERRAA